MVLDQIIPLVALASTVISYMGYKSWQVVKERKANQKLSEQNQQLQAEKAVAEAQVKNHQARKQNEENINSISRSSIIDRLHENGDLRGDE
ncbi:DUF2681 domain-containing protein [Mannheimia haemolytica]|uniref:DUF2681 domain-containing protein n=1 Tax=Mannheimia haemolytica TaxID=75985 RepID=UPI000386988B|nr:DUF2681 domain-containing protein [Mannheimia haemolytica]EPZ00556.1 hypothetical protein L278_00820 [Mannheimia haemolytica D35]MDW0617352.1 DUF2681 domain-containing protein [Mannheimia haemolytica]MDW1149437.1 DUF2681 domain-containing protein [Mannheimia haemolytica]MDW1159533.1 DUF2681 domain-containing protein [Mannheimia haemolytica]NBB66851.1 DUF2681 domain-containing protein [Mannheimia haemolytica]